LSHNNENNLIQISSSSKDKLKKAKYGVYNHSAVELCHWTKKSFLNEGTCYKHKFYGISTHQCMEMTPTALNCENRCIYCWRPTEFYDTLHMPLELVDEPDVIVNQLLHERRKLIVGFYGNKKSDKTKIDESLLPSHYAISLSGEPTMYPKLPYLINYLNSLKQTKSIFLVTNGQEPEMLERLQKENALPTQIYLSTNASNKIMFHKVNGPKYRDAWERWNNSLKFIADTSARTVLRITLIRNYNDKEENIKEFAELILKGNPHFIEIKSYMHIGMSTQRLERDNMLSMNEIRKFTQKLCYYMSDFKIMDESEVSRIMVIQNQKRYIDRWIKAYT
jgi:tRNA wybutosine-synthesizing protein 1